MTANARDNFEVYYSEKLWELVPAIYRHEDGLANPANVLRGVIEVIAAQAAIVRRSQDRLWDDQFIDLCDDWAIPYIADLLATRLLSSRDPRAQRNDVAGTISRRRRKGTPPMLEELISDIGGWKGKMVESFQRLVRTRHALDPQPTPLAGRFTGTMPGGIADLRKPVGTELSTGPFDEYFHLPDFRRPRGQEGHYGITKLIFHLYTLVSYEANGITPFQIQDGQYTFDPSGRKIPLFIKDPTPRRNSWQQWHSAFEWELPLPIRCRLLAHVEFEIKEEAIIAITTDLGIRSELRKLKGARFKSEDSLLEQLSSLAIDQKEMMRLSIIDDCGKNQLWPVSLSINTGAVIQKEDIKASHYNLSNTDLTKQIMVDAENGIFWFTDNTQHANKVSYHYGFSGNFGAGFYDRSQTTEKNATRKVLNQLVKMSDVFNDPAPQIVEIVDNLTYAVEGNMSPILNFTIRAANFCRPYIHLDKHWIFEAGPNDCRLEIDGLWLGSVAGSVFNVILRGDFESIIIRNCTFDPGGNNNVQSDPLQPVSLIIEGNVENICIENCIMGPISIAGSSILDESICISDSIVQSDNITPALLISTGKTVIQRSTIFGGITVHRLYATDSIITGITTAIDNQSGCFRFSAAPSASQLPRPFESFLFDISGSIDYWFTSRVFGNPGYSQLSVIVPVAVYRGGENGAEMGVFNRLINAIKIDGLQSKVDEYMPFGLIPAFVSQT